MIFSTERPSIHSLFCTGETVFSIVEASFTLRSVCTTASELLCKHTEKENGLQDLLEIMLESLMLSERQEYLQEEGPAENNSKRLSMFCIRATKLLSVS